MYQIRLRVTWAYLPYVCLYPQVRDIVEGKESRQAEYI